MSQNSSRLELADAAILKGLNHPAQGCEARATLGYAGKGASTLKGLHQNAEFDSPVFHDLIQPFQGWKSFARLTQGSSRTRNPGLNDGIPSGFPRGTNSNFL